MTPKYYKIDEQTARLAKQMNSFDDYLVGSKTAAYRSYVDDAYAMADEAAEVRPSEAERVYGLADRYSKKLAENLNRGSRISAMCPSVMISGAGNFPVAKKRKQNVAWDKNMREFGEIQKILDKIRAIATGKEVIKSGDADAVAKLEAKVEALEKRQEMMKSVNTWYKKHGTLDGCPELTEAQIEEFKKAMQASYRLEDRPFMRFELSNNGQNLRKNRERLENLKKAKESASKEIKTDLFKVIENTELMRLQLIFAEKPDEETRTVLKKHGFRWSPRQNAWQRQLTDNARYALKQAVEELKGMREVQT